MELKTKIFRMPRGHIGPLARTVEEAGYQIEGGTSPCPDRYLIYHKTGVNNGRYVAGIVELDKEELMIFCEGSTQKQIPRLDEILEQAQI